MPIKLVVFDLAGTTVQDNHDVHRVLQNVLAQHQVFISLDDANEVMGIPKPVAIRLLVERAKPGKHLATNEWVSKVHTCFVNEMVHFYSTDIHVEEKENATEIFQALKKRNIKVIVDTGFDRLITNSILNRLGWFDKGIIDGSVSSDEVVAGRPEPDMIYKAMELAGVSSAKEVAKIGDTPSDIQEGIAAGCALVIGVTTGAFRSELLAKENPTHLVENLLEIISIMDQIDN